MSKIVVLFNLMEGVSVDVYEDWARTTDLPTVNGLQSVGNFDVLKCSGLLGSEQAPPYQYIEIIDINDRDRFFEDVSTETMQRVAGEFQAFADSPMFIVTEHI